VIQSIGTLAEKTKYLNFTDFGIGQNISETEIQ
jgi:hypothetical protein